MLCSLEKHASLENDLYADHSTLEEELKPKPKSARCQCVVQFPAETASSTLPYENRQHSEIMKDDHA
jgi:hypothetical protein